MEFRFDYEPAKFGDVLSDIRTAFPYFEEYNESNNAQSASALSERLVNANENGLRKFANTLTGSELELILYIIKASEDPGTLSRAETVLRLRFRKKLFDLCWNMLQSDFDNPGLLRSAGVLSEYMRQKFPDHYEASLLYKTEKFEGSLPERAHRLLAEELSDIRGFCRRYSILESSVLAQRLRELYFIACEAGDYVNNRESLLKHMDVEDVDSVALVFSAYLDKMRVIEYFDIVNRMAANKWGNPEDGGEIWQRLDDKQKAKFKGWQDLKRIEQHFGSESKRYKFWAEYFQDMLRIEYHEAAALLIMEFSDFYAVDAKAEDGWSYIYAKDYFVNEYARFEDEQQNGAQEWRINPEHVADARDFVIEEIRSDIYRVGYNRVHILYLKEILKHIMNGN